MTAVDSLAPRPGVACHNGDCSAPASLAIRVGCVHEHIVWTVGCVEHVEGFRLAGPRRAGCAAGRLSLTAALCGRSCGDPPHVRRRREGECPVSERSAEGEEMSTYTGRRIQELTVRAVESAADGGSYITASSGWTAYAGAPVAARLPVGTEFEQETQGFSRVTGWRVNGEWLARQSDEDLDRQHRELVERNAARNRERLEAHRDEWTRRSAELPGWARERLNHFREQGGDNFEVGGWGYELVVCELAVMYYADGFADTERINAYADRVGSSGNQHDCAKVLARARHQGESLAGTVSALTPLTGDPFFAGGAR